MKFGTKPALRVVPAAQLQLSLNLQGVLRDVQQAFYGLCVNAGKQVLAAMMEADRVALCGVKNVPDAGRPIYIATAVFAEQLVCIALLIISAGTPMLPVGWGMGAGWPPS